MSAFMGVEIIILKLFFINAFKEIILEMVFDIQGFLYLEFVNIKGKPGKV